MSDATTARDSAFLNRELSWLEFNDRVLAEAMDEAVPLLERIKFLAITGSNLDEFFMVRVGGLQVLELQGSTRTCATGMSATQQLEAISKRAHDMAKRQYACLLERLLPMLSEAGIRALRPDALTERQRAHAETYFEKEIFPVVTPIAVGDEGEALTFTNRTIGILVRLVGEDQKDRWAVVPLVRSMARLVTLPVRGAWEFLFLDDLVSMFIDRLFPGVPVREAVAFRVIRNADLELQEDQASDLLDEMKQIIEARRTGHCVRLEVAATATRTSLARIQSLTGVSERDTYRIAGPLDLAALMKIADVPGHEALRNPTWPAHAGVEIAPDESVFEAIGRGDILLHHPYDSYDPVVRLLDEAADDPQVLAIKQTLYRTSRESPIVKALIRASLKGKYVTAVVELKARFDEERNIEWAEALEKAGVQVIYGVKRLKTHAKCLMVVRREPGGVRRYLHFGTGNYNEISARLYTDISLLTCDEAFGRDASVFFNAITGVAQPQSFERLAVAPLTLRDKILELIAGEAERKRQGQEAFIRAKMNSLTDTGVIEALYEASRAGVKIELNVRGICCLKPRVAGMSDQITVISIVDRFLEHSRIFHFHQGGEDALFLSSADWMSRNLDSRVELLVPVLDLEARRKLMRILEVSLKSREKAWRLHPEGRYERRAGSGTRKGSRAQEQFHEESAQAAKDARRGRAVVFEPYTPK